MEDLNIENFLNDPSFINYCNNSNPEDVAKWEKWKLENPKHAGQINKLVNIVQTLGYVASEDILEQTYSKLQDAIKFGQYVEEPAPRKFNYLIWFAAASILIILGAMLMIWKINTARNNAMIDPNTIMAASGNATLTLSDGTTLNLKELQTGKELNKDGIKISKSADGEITYMQEASGPEAQGRFNTISTANAGKFKVILPDASVAWLNAGSSLRYPINFGTKERRVKMNGEVYFEIAKKLIVKDGQQKRLPFIVETNQQTVEVLGTHFNINAYMDDPSTKTTLLEGSVLVESLTNKQKAKLMPGQQAILTNSIQVVKPNLEKIMDWKNGDFIFQEDNLGDMLKEIGRWYNLEIECPDHLAKYKYSGMISRSQPLRAIVDLIQSAHQIKIVIKERRLIVTN